MSNISTPFSSSTKLPFPQILGISAHDPLDGFVDMWYHVFLWSLFSSILVHVVAALIACGHLKHHKIGRFVPIIIIIMGILSPIIGGAITSAAIAGIYRASGFEMGKLYALVWGVGQTIVLILISFTRILATL